MSRSSGRSGSMELDDHSPAGEHAIDFVRLAKQKKQAAAAKLQQQRKPAPVSDDDDPYTDPPASSSAAAAAPSHHHASTAGDEFYDVFARLERVIAEGSALLRACLQIMKLIKQHPAQARELKDELHSKLDETSAKLDEISLVHTRFQSLSIPVARAKDPEDKADKAKRRELRAQVQADIDNLTKTFAQIRAAGMAQIQGAGAAAAARKGNGAYTRGSADDDDDGSHQALLGSDDSSSHLPDDGDSSMTYQSMEYIGDIDGHLRMLESSARERAEMLQGIEKDVVQVAGLMSDVHYLVNAQQSMVDTIGDNIERTSDNSERALKELLQAQAYQQKKRKNMCCLALFGVIALALFFLFLWVAFGN